MRGGQGFGFRNRGLRMAGLWYNYRVLLEHFCIIRLRRKCIEVSLVRKYHDTSISH